MRPTAVPRTAESDYRKIRPRSVRRAAVPARRLGTPDEFGATCAFLCSQHGAYITGQNILMDGGAYPGTY